MLDRIVRRSFTGELRRFSSLGDDNQPPTHRKLSSKSQKNLFLFCRRRFFEEKKREKQLDFCGGDDINDESINAEKHDWLKIVLHWNDEWRKKYLFIFLPIVINGGKNLCVSLWGLSSVVDRIPILMIADSQSLSHVQGWSSIHTSQRCHKPLWVSQECADKSKKTPLRFAAQKVCVAYFNAKSGSIKNLPGLKIHFAYRFGSISFSTPIASHPDPKFFTAAFFILSPFHFGAAGRTTRRVCRNGNKEGDIIFLHFNDPPLLRTFRISLWSISRRPAVPTTAMKWAITSASVRSVGFNGGSIHGAKRRKTLIAASGRKSTTTTSSWWFIEWPFSSRQKVVASLGMPLLGILILCSSFFGATTLCCEGG